MRQVRDRVLERLQQREPDEEEVYFVLLPVLHEDMHTEAFTYTRQTLGYPPPRLSPVPGRAPAGGGGPLPGDAEIPGGTSLLGATPDEPFVFDNEKWAHPVEVKPFALARAPVTQAEFAVFVHDDGYRRRELWSEEGWPWRETMGAEHPVYWQRVSNSGWLRRHFDKWVPLEADHPVIHVSWYEAEAYCRWAGRRLPTEAEWEVAAAAEPDPKGGCLSPRKRRFPWGDGPPHPEHANLDWHAMGCLDVGTLPAGDSAFGCRQMIGNVWEWTSSDFLPYPGFVVDPYKEYSAPWFGTRKVLRGGSWATRSRLLRNTWRNFYGPDRRDVWAGFRTCALEK
jgi:iron(II)-dependent oxidoreductase